MTTEREPCPACREPIDPDARRCPHCRSEVLFEVRLSRAVADGRTRYRAARGLVALGPGLPPLGALQRRLSAAGVLLSGTRGLAGRAAEVLEPLGIAVDVRPATGDAPRPGTGRLPRPLILAGGAAAVGLLGLGLLLLLLRGDEPGAPAAEPAPAAVALTPAELAERALPGTAALSCDSSLGSGFFVAPDRVITNAHVLCPVGETMEVHLSDGRQGTGRPLRRDDRLDLALVEVSGVEGMPLPMGDAGTLRVGDPALMIGSPVGLDFTVHQGQVSNLDRVILGVAFLQIDARVNPGNSGGPLLDAQGRVVGVVSLKATQAEGIGLALPINYAFTGDAAMLAPPSAAPSAGFERMRASAEADDQRLVEELRASGQRPGLIEAAVTPNGLLTAVVVWPSEFEPFDARLYFNLRSGGVARCEIVGQVPGWFKAGSGDDSPVPPRTRAWLENHGFSSQIWVTSAVLDWRPCAGVELGTSAGSVELELQGADADASRVPIGRAGG